MMKITRGASVGTVAALAACLMGMASSARALTSSDKPAAILIWPKIVVDTSGAFGAPTDTLVQLSSSVTLATGLQKQAHCFYINANSHCAADSDTPGAVCQAGTSCPAGNGRAACEPSWSEIDFDIILTPEQPIAWQASSGLQNFPLTRTGFCTNRPTTSCSQSNASQVCPGGDCTLLPNNLGSAIPPVPEDPFVGTLKCVEFSPGQNPPVPDQSSTRNTLFGGANIQSLTESDGIPGGIPVVERYNAVGLLATGNTDNANGTNVLQIGGNVTGGGTGANDPEYSACPAFLVLNHFFDNSPLADNTDLTLVPCGDNFQLQEPGRATAQFVVFNEFEQRFSTSRLVDCFFERSLSTVDTTNPSRSIFSFNVAGTVVGQTRIMGVGGADTGRGLVGVARKSFGGETSAYNLFQTANPDFTRVQPDVITLP